MTLSGSSIAVASPAQARKVPPLEQGDRLTRAQFMERYAAMPSNVKAERIEGMVYMSSAVSAAFHGQPHAWIMGWLVAYCAATPGLAVADNSTIALDLDNDPQPDACLRIDAAHGGKTTLNADGYIQSAPELIVEIAASTMSYDLGAKLNAYRRNGVAEYIVYRSYDGEFDWFVLRDGEYARVQPDANGLYRSALFPGLWLDSRAFVAQDLPRLMATLRAGMADAQHDRFVQELAARAERPS